MNPVREAIEVFLEIKRKLDEAKLSEGMRDKIKSKLRTRAREIPGMIIDTGLVPTLSFCLAKAGIDKLRLVLKLMGGYMDSNKLENIKPEEISYALYTYVVMKYLDRIKSIKPGIREFMKSIDEDREFSNKLYEYLKTLMQSNIALTASKLLQPYFIQFKRLCEAEFKPE